MFTTTHEMAETMEALVLKGGPHCTAAHARRVLLVRFAIAPSVRTVARWIAFLHRERGRALSAATRPDAPRSRRMPAFGAGDGDAFAPNALWELDSTPADLLFADPLTGVLWRHAVVGALEVWSRRGMVLIVPASRGLAITALLRRCLVTWGVPLAVKIDRGRDYVGRHVTRVLADLEIKHDLCRPYRPEDKPHIERFLGTLTRDLFAHLPGFTGHDVAQAKALRETRSFAARRRGEAPTFEFHLTAAELQRRCDLWLSGVYEASPHRGLDGMTPRLRAASWTCEVRAIADVRALDALLTPAAGGRHPGGVQEGPPGRRALLHRAGAWTAGRRAGRGPRRRGRPGAPACVCGRRVVHLPRRGPGPHGRRRRPRGAGGDGAGRRGRPAGPPPRPRSRAPIPAEEGGGRRPGGRRRRRPGGGGLSTARHGARDAGARTGGPRRQGGGRDGDEDATARGVLGARASPPRTIITGRRNEHGEHREVWQWRFILLISSCC